MGTLGWNMSIFGFVKVPWGGRGDKGDVVWQTNYQVQCSKYDRWSNLYTTLTNHDKMSFYYSVASLQSIVFTRLKNWISFPQNQISASCTRRLPPSTAHALLHEAQSRREVCQRRSCLATKKMGACQKRLRVRWSFVVVAGAEQKTSAVFIIRSRWPVLFTSPPAARKRMLFLEKKQKPEHYCKTGGENFPEFKIVRQTCRRVFVIPLSVFHHFGCHCSVGRLINIDLNSKNKYCIGNASSTEHECNNKPLQTAGVLSRAPGWRHILYILTCIWYLPDARVKRKLFLRSESSLCSLGKRCENLWGATCAVITDVSH